jgi:hypothetical protein
MIEPGSFPASRYFYFPLAGISLQVFDVKIFLGLEIIKDTSCSFIDV